MYPDQNQKFGSLAERISNAYINETSGSKLSEVISARDIAII